MYDMTLLSNVLITYLWYVLAPTNQREDGECDGNYPYEQYYEVCLFIITSSGNKIIYKCVNPCTIKIILISVTW